MASIWGTLDSMRLAFSQSGVPYPPPGLSGLGLDAETNSIAAQAMSGAATTGAILTGLAHMGMISAAFGPAAPIAAIVVGIAAIGVSIANQFHGCGQTCIAASQIADKVEVYLKQNKDAYLSASPRYRSLQLAALNNFDLAAKAMNQACGDPALGDAGQRCISERLVRGGSAPWCPTGTGCDWYILYRDPIANDSTVVPDPAEASSYTSSLGLSTGGGFPVPLLIAGVGLAAFFMVSD